MRARTATLLLAGLALAAQACAPSDGAAPAADWPAGTVLAVNGRAIFPDEVDRIAGWFLSAEPKATPLRLRRVALTNVVFPRLAARELAEERWRAARDEATATSERLATDEAVAATAGETLTGSWQMLGPETFGVALETGPGRWSTVIETVGAFHLVYLVKASENGATLDVRRIDFPYLDASGRARVEAQLDAAELVIVDESWREAVPLSWIHRMRGGSP